MPKPPPPPPLALVPPAEIPEAGDTPVHDLMSVFRLAVRMERLCHSLGGVGLSAAQVGVPWRFFVLRRGDGFEHYLNCDYVGSGEKFVSIEGCLSLTGADGGLRRFEVDRFPSVEVKGLQLLVSDSPTITAVPFRRTESGVPAVVFQHEIDHEFGRSHMIDVIGRELDVF